MNQFLIVAMTIQNLSNQTIIKLIGKRISFFRKEQKMGRELLASKTGMCKEQLRDYEKGRRRITADRLFTIAKILNVKVINFFPVFVLDENISELLTELSNEEIKLLDKFAKSQNISVEELVLKFLELLLK